jgi:hypothetical protein
MAPTVKAQAAIEVNRTALRPRLAVGGRRRVRAFEVLKPVPSFLAALGDGSSPIRLIGIEDRPSSHALRFSEQVDRADIAGRTGNA